MKCWIIKKWENFMISMKYFFGVVVVFVLIVGFVFVEFVLIFDFGGKFDKFFNEVGYNGV